MYSVRLQRQARRFQGLLATLLVGALLLPPLHALLLLGMLRRVARLGRGMVAGVRTRLVRVRARVRVRIRVAVMVRVMVRAMVYGRSGCKG